VTRPAFVAFVVVALGDLLDAAGLRELRGYFFFKHNERQKIDVILCRSKF
jgi:hypothetical protein